MIATRLIPLLIAAATLCGCSAGSGRATPAADPAPRDVSLHSPLVMPGTAPARLASDPANWVFSRNDAQLGAPPRPLDPQVSVSESWKRQRRHISSGRLRENTTLTTRTYSRRGG